MKIEPANQIPQILGISSPIISKRSSFREIFPHSRLLSFFGSNSNDISVIIRTEKAFSLERNGERRYGGRVKRNTD